MSLFSLCRCNPDQSPRVRPLRRTKITEIQSQSAQSERSNMEGPSSLDDHRYDHHSRLLCTTSHMKNRPHWSSCRLIVLMNAVCGLLVFFFYLFYFLFSVFLFFFQHIYTRILPNVLYLWYCQGNGIIHVMFSGWYLRLLVIFECLVDLYYLRCFEY